MSSTDPPIASLRAVWRAPLRRLAKPVRKAGRWLGRSGVAGALRTNIRWIGAAVALVVVIGSCVVLVNLLRDIDLGEVATTLRERRREDVALAAACILLAYGTLSFYDWFALRTIGALHVPYRIAALASFASYAIGHNIGATAFSGGAIRYRVYSAWGLSVVDVAKICFVTGLTFWLGNLTVLGLGMAHVPQAASAIDQLPAEVNRVIGIGALGLLAGYVAWAGREPRTVGGGDWTLTLPSGGSTLLQVAIGFVDLTFCSLAMYMLMPADPPVAFVAFAVMFVSATLLGFASHSPGSLGVFDAAMLVAFAQFDKEDLVAGLLLFRLLYFIVPFTVALTIMAVREATMWARRRRDEA